MMKFNYLKNDLTNELFPASQFFFYPLKVEDYVGVYKNPNIYNYPVMAFIYLTNKCNDRCNGCFASTIEDGNAELRKDILIKLLRDLKDGGTKAIKLAGREPTASNNLSLCLDYCSNNDMKTLVITSGTNLDAHWISLANSCTHLRVSLNTINQKYHKALHNPTDKALSFNDRIYWVKKILKIRNKHDLISGATFLVRPTTISYAYEYARMCKDLGFNYVRYTVLDDADGQYPIEWDSTFNKVLTLENHNFKVMVHKQIDLEYQNRLKPITTKSLVDPAIISRVTIHANGKVASCHEGWRAKWPSENMAIYGNLYSESFNAIWKGKKRTDFLNYIHNNMESILHKPVCCSSCKYDSFNSIQHWLINSITDDYNVTFSKVQLPRKDLI